MGGEPRGNVGSMKGETPKTGTFLGVPYDWRKPTKDRFKQRMWNEDDPRWLTPRAYGWGYDLNLRRIFRKRKK